MCPVSSSAATCGASFAVGSSGANMAGSSISTRPMASIDLPARHICLAVAVACNASKTPAPTRTPD
jgi:hypothetical protein